MLNSIPLTFHVIFTKLDQTTFKPARPQCKIKREGQSEGVFKMPAAVASSVKHPDGIYLTAGTWTSRVLFFASDLYPSYSTPTLLHSSSLPLHTHPPHDSLPFCHYR